MKEINLSKKRVLYIGPASFYDKSIMKKLASRGATVDSYDIMNFYPNDLLFRAKTKFVSKKRNVYEEYREKFFNKILSKGNYDFVLVRTGSQLTEAFLQQLRKLNPVAKFINFHWDALRPDYSYLSLIKYYDKIFSFDVKDCREHAQINYLPLFYLDVYDEFRKKTFDNFKQKENDLLFIGAWRNKERYDLIMQTDALCKKQNLSFVHYLYLSSKGHFYSIKKGIVPKKAKTKELSHPDILEFFAKTNTIIDFPSTFQTGMTMRTFETLGAGKKLITTNKSILSEPFYDPEFINVIDMNNITLDMNFIKNVPVSSMEEKIKDYSIDGYLYNLFN